MSEPQVVNATLMYAECGTLDTVLLPMPVEKWETVLDALFTHYAMCIEKNGGEVVKYFGSSVMALFTDEGHEEKGWIAARMIVENAEIIGHGLPKNTEIHASLNSGPALVGDFGTGPSAKFDVYGHTVNLAAHILGGYSGLIMAGENTVMGLPETVEVEEWDQWGETRIYNIPTRLELDDLGEEY